MISQGTFYTVLDEDGWSYFSWKKQAWVNKRIYWESVGLSHKTKKKGIDMGVMDLGWLQSAGGVVQKESWDWYALSCNLALFFSVFLMSVFEKRIPRSYLRKNVNVLPVPWSEVQKPNGKVLLFSLLSDDMCSYVSTVSGDKIKPQARDSGKLLWMFLWVLLLLCIQHWFMSSLSLGKPDRLWIGGPLWFILILELSQVNNNSYARAFCKQKSRGQTSAP